jgi:hypothetical protein
MAMGVSVVQPLPVLSQVDQVRVVIASNVACRDQPGRSSPSARRFDVGDRILPRERQEVSGEVWYLDTWHARRGFPGCWILEGLTSGWSDRESALLAAADRILSRTDEVPFEEFVAVDNFLLRTLLPPQLGHADTKVIDHSPLLQLRRLQILYHAGNLPSADRLGAEKDPLMAAWFLHNGDVLRYHEPAGRWVVTADTFWALYERHRDSEWAEEMAWAAARGAVVGDECDGPCILRRLLRTVGRYWEEFPAGQWVGEAIERAERAAERGARMGCWHSSVDQATEATRDLRVSLEQIDPTRTEQLLAIVGELERQCSAVRR